MANEQPNFNTTPKSTEPTRDVPTAPELQATTPPVAPPSVPYEIHEHDGRRWPAVLLYLVAAFIVALLIALAARAIYHSIHHSPKTVGNPTGQTPGLPTPNPTKPAKNHKTATSGSSNVANTGPGNVVALFVGTTIVAGGLHYIYQLRRAG